MCTPDTHSRPVHASPSEPQPCLLTLPQVCPSTARWRSGLPAPKRLQGVLHLSAPPPAVHPPSSHHGSVPVQATDLHRQGASRGHARKRSRQAGWLSGGGQEGQKQACVHSDKAQVWWGLLVWHIRHLVSARHHRRMYTRHRGPHNYQIVTCTRVHSDTHTRLHLGHATPQAPRTPRQPVQQLQRPFTCDEEPGLCLEVPLGLPRLWHSPAQHLRLREALLESCPPLLAAWVPVCAAVHGIKAA